VEAPLLAVVRSAIVLSTFRVKGDHTPKIFTTSHSQPPLLHLRSLATSPAAVATPAQEEDKEM